MTHRKDKFKIGETVRWSERAGKECFLGLKKRFGDGPFVVSYVFDLPEHDSEMPGEQSTWDSVGHTQWVRIDGGTRDLSGVWFKKVKP